MARWMVEQSARFTWTAVTTSTSARSRACKSLTHRGNFLASYGSAGGGPGQFLGAGLGGGLRAIDERVQVLDRDGHFLKGLIADE